MFRYYLDLAWRSLKRSPGMTALMVLSIGIGVALAMTAWTMVHLMGRDPLPQKSAEVYFPTIDAWGPAARKRFGNQPQDWLDYATATALLRDRRAKYQAAVYAIPAAITPPRAGEFAFHVNAFAVSSEFFPLVAAPFKYGTGWNAADEGAAAQVAVITARLSRKLFGTAHGVGKSVVVNRRTYRVVGVLADWNPQPQFFDIDATQGMRGFAIRPTELYVPFSTAVAEGLQPTDRGCFHAPADSGLAALKRSDCVWISYLAELDSPTAVRRYRAYLDGFARERFAWAPNVHLRDLMTWLRYEQVVQPGFKIFRIVGFALLVVCLVDTIGLMLAKFLRRSTEVGVRRALGAPRRAIYAQFLTEAGVIGVVGGALGIVLTVLAMAWIRSRYPRQWAPLAKLNVAVLALTLAVAIFSTVLVSLYPVWRMAHVAPALQVKTN